MLDVHLMVEHPERQVASFVDAGADVITVHVESCQDPAKVLQYIRSQGLKAGITLCPATPLDRMLKVVQHADLALVMSVVPGRGGQAYIPQSTDRIRRLRKYLDACQQDTLIQVDGGVKEHNVLEIVAAGADVLVAGSAVFRVLWPRMWPRSRRRFGSISQTRSGYARCPCCGVWGVHVQQAHIRRGFVAVPSRYAAHQGGGAL